MYRIFNFFKRLALYVRLDYRLRKAVSIADGKANADNGQYFVLPDKYKNLVVISFKEYKRLRRKGKASNASIDDLYKECFYCTRWKKMAKLTKSAIKVKRKMYFEYYMR